MVFCFNFKCFAIICNSILISSGLPIQEQDYGNGVESSTKFERVILVSQDNNTSSARQARFLPLITGVVKVLPTLADSISVYQAATDSFSYVKRKFGSSEDETPDVPERSKPQPQLQELRYPKSSMGKIESIPEKEEAPLEEKSADKIKGVQKIFLQNIIFNIHYDKPGKYEILIK